MRTGEKSHLVDTLEGLIKPLDCPAPKDGDDLVFDGAVLDYTFTPLANMVFSGCAINSAGYIRSEANKLHAQRFNVVWDIYSQSSLKGFARESRGTSVRRQDLPTNVNK